MNTLSQTANHLSNTICYGAVCGGLGYLAHRVVNQIDPRVGLICGVTAGTTTVLFFNENTNLARRIIGVAILAIAPQKICEHLKIPAQFQIFLAITVVTTALAVFFQIFHENYIREQEPLEFELNIQEMEQKFQVDNGKMKKNVKNMSEKIEQFDEDLDEVVEDVEQLKESHSKIQAELKKTLEELEKLRKN